jgi:hypothetical protein
MTDHGEQGKLPHMKDGFSRETPCKEENDASWCLLVQSLQVLDGILVVFVNYFGLSLIEDK